MFINRMWVLRKRPESRIMVRSGAEVSRWLAMIFTEQGNFDRRSSIQDSVLNM